MCTGANKLFFASGVWARISDMFGGGDGGCALLDDGLGEPCALSVPSWEGEVAAVRLGRVLIPLDKVRGFRDCSNSVDIPVDRRHSRNKDILVTEAVVIYYKAQPSVG